MRVVRGLFSEVFGSFPPEENWSLAFQGKFQKKKKEKKGRKEGRKEVNSQAGARVTPRRDTGVAVRARGLATIPPG